jgi:hypothetical protein
MSSTSPAAPSSPPPSGPVGSDPPEKKKSRRPMIVSIVVVLALLFALAMYLFQPWTALTTTTVDEALPAVPSSSATTDPSPPTQAANVVLRDGPFESLDKDTSGQASLIRLTDGRTILRMSDFSTSSGPDVKVWLSEESVGRADSPEEGRYINLGDLKGNKGNQNYEVPSAQADREWRSVIIWCERFSVAFGAAELAPGSPTPRS